MSDTSRIPSVSLLVLNWNGRTLLESCLPPLLAQDYVNFHVLMVDNASEDDSVAYVREGFPAVEILENAQNLGFAGGVNVGLRHLQARRDEYVILLNTDVVVPAGWLSDFVAAIEGVENLGVAGCKLLFPDGRIQHLGAEFDEHTFESRHFHQFKPDTALSNEIVDVGYVTGAAFVISKRALARVPLFDERFKPFYFEEVDYCYQVREAGLRVVIVPAVRAVHDESTSIKKVPGLLGRSFYINRLRFVLKHFPRDKLLGEFVPVEQARLAGIDSAEMRSLNRAVLLDVLLELPQLLARDGRTDELAVLQTVLLELREAVVVQSPNVIDLGTLATLDEHQFDSGIPGVAALRRAWHGVAGRWAIGHMLRQQMRFNRAVVARLDMVGDSAETERLLLEVVKLQQAQSVPSSEEPGSSG